MPMLGRNVVRDVCDLESWSIFCDKKIQLIVIYC